jgi:hypothetical protein
MDSSTTLRRIRIAPDQSPPPATLPQFAHVNRYWDTRYQCFAARLLPGEYYVSTTHEIIATVWDPACPPASAMCASASAG